MYRQAVVVDDWVLTRVAGAHWEDPSLALSHDEACVVVANHRSWTDIFLLQSVLAQRGLIVKFLSKRELAYIPILGLIFIAFDFPVLARKARGLQSESDRRADDRCRVREACEALYRAPSAMLSFVEGTRFSEAKRITAGSSYRHLLPPRPAGFSAIIEAVEPLQPNVVDVTLVYPRQVNFWQFLGGTAGEIRIVAMQFPVTDVLEQGALTWLEDRWEQKDRVLAAQQREADRADKHAVSLSNQA